MMIKLKAFGTLESVILDFPATEDYYLAWLPRASVRFTANNRLEMCSKRCKFAYCGEDFKDDTGYYIGRVFELVEID